MTQHALKSFLRTVVAQAFGVWLFSWLFLLSPRSVAQVAQLQREVGVTTIRQVEDVIRGWSPENHVFVKGDIGVGPRQLEELQQWIEKNASNWIVVLMQDTDGEYFHAADGRDYRGMDAVEYALGYGLSNRTDFGNLEHPRTKERYGAVFALFLRERKFSYFGSDAQDRRGLGEANWIGELDQPAFRAMRSGGRVIDAAKDTIAAIDAKLAAAIQAESDAERRVAVERQRAVEELRRGVAAARDRIEDVRLDAAHFRLQQPSAKGPLADPPLQAWGDELAALEVELGPTTARGLVQQLAKLNDEIERHLNGYASLAGLAAGREQVLKRLDELAKSPGRVAAANIATVQKLLDEVEQREQAGNLGTDQLLANIDAAIDEGLRNIAAEQQQFENARLRSVWIRRTVLFMLFLIAVAVAGLLALLNRRRRPAMLKAIAELSLREESVAAETDGINVLFVRNEELLGSREKLQLRGYEGLTQEISEQAMNYIDDLFILSKEVRRVLSEARELVTPRNTYGRLVNLFSSTRYQQAVNEISGKPLHFTRTGGLPLVLRDQVALNGDGSLPDEISMTFEQVFEAFQQRGDDVEKALNTIESSLAKVHEALSELQADLERLTVTEKELAAAAAADHYFGLANFFEKLIPAVERDVSEADKQSAFDAVQAMQLTIPEARRKLSQARALAEQLLRARADLFPEFTTAAVRLKDLGYTSDWIDADLLAITAQADELMLLATRRSIEAELQEVGVNLENLRAKSRRSVQLATQIHQELMPSIDELSERIESTRGQLAHQLNQAEEAVLNEPDRDPDEWLATARKYLGTAQNTLSLGRNEVVQSALEAMQSAAARADAILGESTAAVADFDRNQQAARSELERLHSRIPQIEQELAPVQRSYVSSTLLLQDPVESVTDAATEAAPATTSVETLIRSAAAPSGQIDRCLTQASEQHMRGNVLQAADLQVEASHVLARSHQRLDHVQQHLQAIAVRTGQNQGNMVQLEQRVETLTQTTQDPLITQQTVAEIASVQRNLAILRQQNSSSKMAPNPFEVEHALLANEQALIRLDAQCIADRQAHAEAARAVDGARRQILAAQQLVSQSQTDGIPDSPLIVQANGAIANLSRDLSRIESDLQVPHGDWKTVDDRAVRLQVDLRAAADTLGGELHNADLALTEFQLASQAVFQAEQWSGSYGINVVGSPGVRELEQARSILQQGNYGSVLEFSRIAMTAARQAVQQAEREVTRRRIAAQQAAEAERRRQASRTSSSTFGGGGFSMGSSGGSFRSSSSRSSSSGSGFSRSGW